MIELLWMPFLACVVLVLIHVYFGSFVIKRGILFIDLALAQWAALGFLVSEWLGIEHLLLTFLFGFGFTVIASLLLSLLKPLYDRVNLQEAVIGVVYIVATALATGLISSTGMEGHHIKEMLAGHLLFLQPKEVILAYGLYTAIAVLLIGLHRHFQQATSRKWNFIFYLLFGCVVTSSVKMVGVLLVFTYLVLPILSTMLFTDNPQSQLKWGWFLGILGSALGLIMSMIVDIPPSYSVILSLSLIWVVLVTQKFIRLAQNK